jgi:hypothetical protein
VLMIVLAVLGVPLWIVLGAVGAGLWSRRTFRRAPGVIAVRCRALGDDDAEPRWPRRASYALWVHDVLVVHQGVALVRNRLLPVARLLPSSVDPAELGSFGERPAAVLLQLDGGEAVEVAAAAPDRGALYGPFANGSIRTSRSGSVDAPADLPKSPDAGW